MGTLLRLGEKLDVKGRTVTVTATAFECLPRVRDYLIEIAAAQQVVTYGELREDLDLPYLSQGMGRLLDLLWVDCERRGEPSLAALVVNAHTHEVGDDFDGDPVQARRAVYRHWT